MTNYEKLCEAAGIKPEWRDYRVKNGKVYNGKNPKNRNIRFLNPDFSAEKQIALIKLFGEKGNICMTRRILFKLVKRGSGIMNENSADIWLGMFTGAIITIIILSVLSITCSNHGFTTQQKLELIQIVKEYK